METIEKPKSNYSVGEKVQYRCKPQYFYIPKRIMTTVCLENNSWSLVFDYNCFSKACSYLLRPANGGLTYDNDDVGYKSNAHFSCKKGYHLIGKAVLSCDLVKGELAWSGKPPRCEKIVCARPPEIKNGKHNASDKEEFQHLETVTYSCDPAPGPDPYTLIGARTIYCSGLRTWSNNAPECKVIQCPLPVLPNGKQVSGFAEKFPYQAVVMLECNAGFYLNGSEILTCGSNSTWEPSLPSCIGGPSHPTKPSVSNYPGYPTTREGLLNFDELDEWTTALTGITGFVGIAVLCVCLYRCFQRRKKKGKTEVKAEYPTYQLKSTSAAEQTN
ncbi:membrane cofactor protein isoform X2 [Tupaia chinensis]|nr:membrane cofactor protein isoform X2 [Tupaia chinensis]